MIETIARGERWPVCPCGGKCRPVNCWGLSYWRCDACKHHHDVQPPVTQQNDLGDAAELEDPEERRQALHRILVRMSQDSARGRRTRR